MRPRQRSTLLAVLLALAVVLPAQGQTEMEEHPGYFPLEELDFLKSEALSLEINLAGGMLEFIAAALDDEDPEFSELVRGLLGIRMRIAETDDLDADAMRHGFGRAVEWLEDNGWETFVRLREDDEQLNVFLRTIDGDMMGMTALILEPDEQVVAINVVGRLDLSLLASLADSLDIPELDVGDMRDEEE